MSEEHPNFIHQMVVRLVQDTVTKHANDLRAWIIEENKAQRGRLTEILSVWQKDALGKLNYGAANEQEFQRNLIEKIDKTNDILNRIADVLEYKK